MGVYVVMFRINVPSLGERVITVPNITADSLAQAIAKAQAGIVIEVMSAQKTV